MVLGLVVICTVLDKCLEARAKRRDCKEKEVNDKEEKYAMQPIAESHEVKRTLK